MDSPIVEPDRVEMSVPRPIADNGLPERDLIARINAGDQSAFEVLFKTYHAALVTFVDAYVDRATGEEIVQEMFLGIWRRHETWRPVGSVRAYLFTAARNQALSIIRKQRVATRAAESRAVDESVLGTIAQPTPAQTLSDNEAAAACRRAIHDLPERSRLVMMLRWDYGMSHAEIAFVLGSSIKAVEAELHRGIKALSTQLSGLNL
jgi:RNA polymerase sigma-70 factor, ECF subfamily